MTTKKIVLIIGAVVLAFGLLIGIFVGGIVLFALYSFGTSDAAVTAREFLKQNQQLQQDVGKIKDFGRFVSGNINVNNGNGTATIRLKVIGERRTTNATVELAYSNGRPWRVISASYMSATGQPIDLLNPYDSYLIPVSISPA